MAIVKTALAYDKRLGDIHTRAFWDRSFRMADRDARLDKANNRATKREIDSMPNLTHLREVACALAEGADSTYKRSLERLWMLIAARVPAKRGDWGVLRIIHEDDDGTDNYVILPQEGHATLVLNRYKTSKKYGRFMEDLPDDVTDAMRSSREHWPREYMFVNAKREPFRKRGTFRNWVATVMKAHLGAPVNINGLRKAWCQTVADGSKCTHAERAKLAKSMLHSVAEQQQSYVHVMP